jgi:hypothetical protein
MLGLAQTSNKIIQKRLASAPKQSATDTVPSAETRSGILPRRLDGRGGASVVAATDAAEPKEIAMPKAKSKRRTPSPSNRSRTAGRNRAPRTTAHKSGKLKAGPKSNVGQRHRSPAQQIGRTESKQTRIIAMLRAPSGATVDAIAHAMGWQQHSVRGFLAGVVRKRLSLSLVSAAAESGRIYRITDRTASPVAAVKTSHAV